MAFLSKLYGKQVNKAAQLAAHKGVGSLLTFDSSTDFPSIIDLQKEKILCGELFSTGDTTGIPEYFDYADTSTRNTYIDGSTNIMYRWKHYTKAQWSAMYWEFDEDASVYIEPKEADAPKREDFNTDEEYNEAVTEWNQTLYPKYAPDGTRLYEYNVPEDGALTGWVYVPCAGGGGGSDLYWNKI